MKEELSLPEAKTLIKDAEFSFRHEECATCECYLGYVTQLKIDSGLEAQQFKFCAFDKNGILIYDLQFTNATYFNLLLNHF